MPCLTCVYSLVYCLFPNWHGNSVRKAFALIITAPQCPERSLQQREHTINLVKWMACQHNHTWTDSGPNAANAPCTLHQPYISCSGCVLSECHEMREWKLRACPLETLRAWLSIPVLTFRICVPGPLSHQTEPQFHHQQTGEENSSSLTQLLLELNETMLVHHIILDLENKGL